MLIDSSSYQPLDY